MKITFIIPYFGRWPVWFPAFLTSCAGNPTINWIFFTDCEIPDPKPDNVKFFPSTLGEMKKLADSKIGMDVNLASPRKLCDLKPAYGHVFEQYLQGYDFWGFCDIDIIWGDIRAFITEEMLNQYDLISSRKNTISGHFTILRNNANNQLLYQSGGVFKELFEKPQYRWFDENAFAGIVAAEKQSGALKVWWEKYLVNHERGKDSHQEYYLDRWLYENGKLYDLGLNGKQKVEHMYLHFINWKVKMKKSRINNENKTNSFFISYTEIRKSPHSRLRKGINRIKNNFYGFWIRENLRIKKIRVMKKLLWGKNKLSSLIFKRHAH